MKQFTKGTEINSDNFYEFYPWDFGPFSVEVYDDITFFQLHGFIDSKISDEESIPESEAEWSEWLDKSGADFDEDYIEEYRDEEFFLTLKGTRFTKLLYDELSTSQRRHLKEFKSRLCNSPLRAILRYVYTRYEEDT